MPADKVYVDWLACWMPPRQETGQSANEKLIQLPITREINATHISPTYTIVFDNIRSVKSGDKKSRDHILLNENGIV